MLLLAQGYMYMYIDKWILMSCLGTQVRHVHMYCACPAIPSSAYRAQTSSTDGVRGLQLLYKGHEILNGRSCKRIMEVDFEGCRTFCGAFQFPNLASNSLYIVM